MIHRRRLSYRGWILFEIMIALTLLAVFVAVSIKLLHTSVNVSRGVGEAGALAARFDGAVGELRRDVWGAASLATSDARTLRIQRHDATVTVWTIDEEGGFLRTGEGTDRQEWPRVGAGVTFEIDGPIVLLIEPSGRRVPLVSQVTVANSRGTP